MTIHLTPDVLAYLNQQRAAGKTLEDICAIEDFSSTLESVILDRLAALDEPVFTDPSPYVFISRESHFTPDLQGLEIADPLEYNHQTFPTHSWDTEIAKESDPDEKAELTRLRDDGITNTKSAMSVSDR